MGVIVGQQRLDFRSDTKDTQTTAMPSIKGTDKHTGTCCRVGARRHCSKKQKLGNRRRNLKARYVPSNSINNAPNKQESRDLGFFFALF